MLPETRGKPLPDFINKETSEQEEESIIVEDKNEVTGYASSVQSGRKSTVFVNEQQGLLELSGSPLHGHPVNTVTLFFSSQPVIFSFKKQEFKKTTTAMGTSLNKMFTEQNNGFARAL